MGSQHGRRDHGLRSLSLRRWRSDRLCPSGRVIGTIRRECLDRVIVFSETSLRSTLGLFTDYYHESRTYLGLGKDAPEPRPIQPPGFGCVVAIPQFGGLHHRYERRAS